MFAVLLACPENVVQHFSPLPMFFPTPFHSKFCSASSQLCRQLSAAHFLPRQFAVVDGKLLMNGSFNWTRQAVLYNQENIVITDNPQLVGRRRLS
jgi:phosphatidylserine/phosphatidylglycerophosphate/cardiolipin synthase-like enzyme